MYSKNTKIAPYSLLLGFGSYSAESTSVPAKFRQIRLGRISVCNISERLQTGSKEQQVRPSRLRPLQTTFRTRTRASSCWPCTRPKFTIFEMCPVPYFAGNTSLRNQRLSDMHSNPPGVQCSIGHTRDRSSRDGALSQLLPDVWPMPVLNTRVCTQMTIVVFAAICVVFTSEVSCT